MSKSKGKKSGTSQSYGYDWWYDAYGYTNSKGAGKYASCHTGNNLIGKIGAGGLYAGGWTRGAKVETGMVVIDLANYKQAGVTATGDGFAKTLAAIGSVSTDYTLLSLPIADFQVPDYPAPIWPVLAQEVQDFMVAGRNVMVCCTGGHGRTGLVIAILARLLGICSDPDPVAWVRSVYCHECVETSGQEKYVFTTLGMPMPDKYRPKTKATVTATTTGGASSMPKSQTGIVCPHTLEDCLHPCWDTCKGCPEQSATPKSSPVEPRCKNCQIALEEKFGDSLDLGYCSDCLDFARRACSDFAGTSHLHTTQAEPATCKYCFEVLTTEYEGMTGVCCNCEDWLRSAGMTVG